MVQKISQVDLDEFISVTGKELTLTEQKDLESFLENRAQFICVPLRTRPLTKEQVAANKQAKKKGKPPVYLQKRGAFKVAPTVLYKAEEEYYDKEEAAARKEELKKAKERGAKKDLKKEEKTGEKTTGKKEQKQEKKTGQKQEQKKEEKKTEEKAEEKKEEKKIIERAEAQPNVPQADHRIYTEEEFIRRSEALKAFHIDQAPQTYAEMEELVIRHKTWTIKDGKDYLAWKKNLSPELIAHLEWLQGYYHYLDVGKEIPRLAPGNYHANLGMVLPYEEQETNNCFACSGTAMLNQFIAKKKGQSQITKIYDQFAMRSFQPKIRLQDPKDEGFVSKESYNHQVQEINQYAGEGKTKTGNVFALGDFILEKLEEQGITDCMLNRMTLHVPTTADGTDTELDKKNKETKYHNMKEIFARQIADIIAKGGVASVLETFGDYGHYLTVTGINEKQELEFYNSSSGKLETKSVDEFIHRGYLYEINWISDKKTPEELTGEFKNLKYDPETGYDLKKMDPTSYHESISHTKGITVNKQLEEENPAYKDVALSVYIPDSKKEVLSKPLFDYRADEGLLTAEEKSKTKEKAKAKTQEKKQEETKQETKQEEEKQEETTQEETKQEEKNKSKTKPAEKPRQMELEEIKKKEQENYNKLSAQISEWEKEIDKDTSGKYNTDNRQSKATVNFIAWLERDKKEEEKSDYKELYRGFRYAHDGAGMTKEEKKQKILTLKKLFNALMSFDIKKLKARRPQDLLNEKQFDNRMFMKFSIDTQLIVNGFAKMMRDPEAQEMLKEKGSDTAFTEEEYLKTKCRMEFFMGVNAVLQGYPNVYVNAKKVGLDPEELMELGLEELRDKLAEATKDKDMAKIEVYANAINLVTALTKNGGYEIEGPMQSYRSFLEDSLAKGRIFEYPEEDAELVSKKVLTDAVGEDTVEKELTEAMKKQKEDFFKARYDKTLPGDEVLDKIVADTLKASFGVTKVSSMTTRRTQAKEKIVLQQRLLAEQEKFLKTREADKRKVRAISEGKFAKINRSFYNSEEALPSLREWMDNQLDTEALLPVGNVQGAVGPDILRRLNDIDVAQFNYKSDEEFLKNFAEKYKLLKKGAAARFFIRKYMQASGKKAENSPVTTWTAKILVFEKLLEDYEDRMKLISSPYYALFVRSDLSRYLKKDGEQAIGKLSDKGLQEFLRLYRKLDKSGFGLGKDHTKFVQKHIEVLGDRRQNYDMKWVQAELGKKKITNDKEAKDFVRERYDRKKAEAQKSFPKDDMEFLKKVKPPVFNLPRDAYDVDSLPQQEEILIKILETGEFSDGKQTVKISREHMDELKKQMKTYADQRRKCFAFWNAYKSVTTVTLCESIDYQNPMLKKKHPEVVKAVDLLMGSGREEDKLIHKQDSSAFYFWADGLRSMFLTLHRQGYTLSQKYENRIHDPKFQEETLNDILINRTNHFSATKKQKEENIRSGKLDKDGNFRFPTYKINGTEFTLYGRNQIFDFLGGKEFKLEGEDVPEILEAFKRLTEYDRLHAIVAQEFMNVGGEKGIIEYVYKEDLKDKVVQELSNIHRLLKGRIPGFTEALTKNYKEYIKDHGISIDYEMLSKRQNEAHTKMDKEIEPWAAEIDAESKKNRKFNTEHRMSKEMVNFIAFTERDKEESEKSDYKTLYRNFRYKYGGRELTKEEKKQKILTLKKIYNLLLNFDIKSLAFQDPKELLTDKFFYQEMFMIFSMDSQYVVNGFAEMMKDKDVQNMIGDSKSDTAFTKEQYQETVNRMGFFMNVHLVLGEYPKLYDLGAKHGIDVDALLKMKPEEIAGLIPKEKNKEKTMVYVTAINLVSALTKDGEYIISDPLQSYQNYLASQEEKKTGKKTGKGKETEKKKETVKTTEKEEAKETVNSKEAEKTKDAEKKEELKEKETVKEATKKLLEDNISSPEMQGFISDVTALLNFLGQKMPPMNFDAEAVDASCLMAVTLYNRVTTAAGNCLSKPECFNNSKDAKAQLEKTRKLCAEESAIFRQKVFEYREMLQNSKEKPEKDLTWYDALHYERAVILNLNNEEGVQMEKEGAKASEGYKLTVKKDKKVYHFQKSEKVASANDQEAVKDFYEKLEAEPDFKEKVLKPIFDGLSKDAAKEDFYGQPFYLFFSMLAKIKPASILNKLVATDSNAKEAIRALDKKQKEEAGAYLVRFAKHMFQRTLAVQSEIENGRKLTDRHVATSRMAELLGLQNMICDSRTAYVRDKDKFIQGNLMEDTEGKESKDLIEEAKEKGLEIGYSEAVISQLFSLEIFDVICGQHDRHHGNFHFTTETKGGKMLLTGVRGLDNDMSFGTLDQIPKNRSRNQMKPVTQTSLRGLPINLVNAIMNLDKKETISFILCDILEQDELDALWSRIKGVQEEIKKLPGLVQDQETGRYQYTDKEDQDDRLRQLKIMKEGIRDAKKRGQIFGLFKSQIANENQIDEMIEKRRRELQGTGS